MNTKADVFGFALNEYFRTKKAENITVHSSIAEDDIIPVSYLFRTFKEMPLLEQKALELCVGSTLDIGSGAGSHSLWLQEQGKEVVGIDISEGAVTLSRKRGHKNPIHTSVLNYAEQHDTLLLLMNGTGIFERISKVDSYLQHLKSLLKPNGQILIDGSDIKFMFEDDDGGYWMDANRDYYGEVTFAMSYKGHKSDTFDWLYLDFELLRYYAKKNELHCELILEGDHYDYLARLTVA